MGANSQRLDQYLRGKFPTLTRRQAEEAIESSLVQKRGGGKIAKGLRHFSPEDLDLTPLERHLEQLRTGNAELRCGILYDEPQFCVIDKPAGMHSHPLSLFDDNTVTHWALYHFPQVAKEFPEVQPTVTPHRLDKETSGVLVVAKNRTGFTKWREYFTNKAVSKEYLAWCWGEPSETAYEVQSTLGHDAADSRKMRCGVEGTPGMRGPYFDTQSSITVVEKRAKMFLARVSCHTGVTHQVRVHCAQLGFPLVGDGLYDPEYSRREPKVEGHLLRAVTLKVPGHVFEAPADVFRARFR